MKLTFNKITQIILYIQIKLQKEGGLMANAVAMMGPFANRMFRVSDAVVSGDVLRMMEAAGPDGLGSMVRAVAEDGYHNPRTGDQMLTDAEFDEIDRVYQFLGFTPKPMEKMWTKRRVLLKAENFFSQRKSDLVKRYIEARQEGDGAEINQITREFGEYNRQRIALGLKPWTAKDLMSAVKRKNTAQRQLYHGVKTTRNNFPYVARLDQVYGR